MKHSVRLGCFAAFWGDTRAAVAQILAGAEVDYLVSDICVSDYLSEITMALLARARAKDPAAGYIGDFIETVRPALPEISRRGIKVITNAGALNPVACASALSQVVAELGLSLRVAAVDGDDLIGRRDAIVAAAPNDMVTGQPIPGGLSSLNAYLGARPIAAALKEGADVVIAGRCVDAAVVLGPLMHEFGWKDDEYDLLAAGTLVGHIVECGPQATGGNVTDWADVPGWGNLGYPIAEVFPDGTAVIGKPANTGGSVTPLTVGEQVVYEGDNANIGVIARRPEFEPILREQLTAARVAQLFAHLEPSSVSRWALPGLGAINLLLRDVLGGCGGTSTLRDGER